MGFFSELLNGISYEYRIIDIIIIVITIIIITIDIMISNTPLWLNEFTKSLYVFYFHFTFCVGKGRSTVLWTELCLPHQIHILES